MAEKSDSPTRVDIGFTGGQVLSLRMNPAEHDSLHQALAGDSPGGWHEITALDSQVSVDLAKVVYVRLDAEENRVGF